MAFKEEFNAQIKRLKIKHKLTTMEAISQIMTELAFLVECAPDKEYEREEMEIIAEEKRKRVVEQKAKYRRLHRDKLAAYAKDYRIKYCGQRKVVNNYG